MELPVTSTKRLSRNNSEIEILTWDQVDEREFYQPRTVEYHQLFLFRMGGGIHEIDSLESSIENYSFHLVPSGTAHCLFLTATVPSMIINFTDAYSVPLSHFQFYVDRKMISHDKYIFNSSKSTFENIKSALDQLCGDYLKDAIRPIILIKFAAIVFRICYESTKRS